MEIRPLSPVLGAEVLGVDLSKPLSPGLFADIHHAHLEHLVLVFRDQTLSPQQQIDFSKRFGPLDAHPLQRDTHLPDYPEILVVSTVREQGRFIGLPNGGPDWHSDLAYMQRPALGSMLYALQVPEEGGDTGFANMYAAYEALPPALSEAVAGKRAVFQSSKRAELPPALHPIVRTHPETGRKSIFANAQLTKGVEGVDEETSGRLLAEVFAHNANPAFHYFHQWQVGDLVFWDNRCVQHVADLSRIHDPGYVRHMLRTTIGGDLPR